MARLSLPMRITVIPVRFPVPPRERSWMPAASCSLALLKDWMPAASCSLALLKDWMPAASCSLALLKEYQRPFEEKCVNRKIFSPACESPYMKRNSNRPLAVESVQKTKVSSPACRRVYIKKKESSSSLARGIIDMQ